jgi:type I restriction-modification system DNA methylase subunit
MNVFMSRTRTDIVLAIGREYQNANTENGEYSYLKAFKNENITPPSWIKSNNGSQYQRLDLRFVHDNISVLIETKTDFESDPEAAKQLQAYVSYEKALTGNNIIAILANIQDEQIKVWRGPITDENLMLNERKLRSFHEYADFYSNKTNDKELVMQNTYNLNELLHELGIVERLRSQFVGTCLLALKNGLNYQNHTTPQIITGISEILSDLLDKDSSKAEKIDILKTKVLGSQDIRSLNTASFRKILNKVNTEILPYINDKSTAGQDLLNLFFVQFNKYVGREDKNQAFTPDHITDFMCKAINVTRNCKILDPCCGSGSFLVRAMMQAMDDCATGEDQKKVQQSHIFGIEYEEAAFGLATTNMLIHSDGNSNIRQGNCFDCKDWIKSANIDKVLMNPPYNANKKHMKQEYTATWSSGTKEDPSKGMYFVKYIANIVKTGKLAVLLPMACAIGNERELRKLKKELLQEHTLDAVFSLPSDIFHPGSGSAVCCMIFTLGTRHDSQNNPIKETFFGYCKNDGFIKKKNLGRVEKVASATGKGVWADIEREWLRLYRDRVTVEGFSAVKKVSGEDEWLCEAYMETDYSNISDDDFEKAIRNYLSYQVKHGLSDLRSKFEAVERVPLDPVSAWGRFKVGEIKGNKKKDSLFILDKCKCKIAGNLIDGIDCFYLGAKKSENGIIKTVAKDTDLLTKGNCIVFICDGEGSIGYSNYMDRDFIGTINLTVGYNENLNQYTGLFLTAVLDLERPKYSFGRKYRSSLSNTYVRLPQTPQGKPDWGYMERYIKSLPYGDKI